MDEKFLILAVLLPILGGASVFFFRNRPKKVLMAWVGLVTVATSALVWGLILTCGKSELTLLHMTKALAFRLRFDALGRFFAGIVATLWPVTVLYAAEYMSHEERLPSFFAFFTMCYGITLGVAMSADLFTMYCFYELLTLVTVPLVMQPMTRKATRAVRSYLAYCLGGAAFAFLSLMFIIGKGNGAGYTFGGVLAGGDYGSRNIMLLFWLFGFVGFGVKAAIFPLHRWLPKASVAPTPVTALLHAVAVVKSGVFAIVRLTYFAYGTELIKHSWAQRVAMCIAIFTIFYGASKALKEHHWKRRLAYSTVANLSYILFGVLMMTEAGLTAGLLHMAFHAEIKILAFFCAGALLHGTGREYLKDMGGIGRRMPVTFACFTVSALALTGIPPFSGFVSKWHLLTAAADSGSRLAYAGAAVLLFAALLTAMYMFTVVCRVWFPAKDDIAEGLGSVHEVGFKMTVPMVLLSVGVLLTGIFAQPIVNAAAAIAAGM
ncbi:MAG: proton-conducting transporter membrane subunit [Clostridia bacterium]|nr:proton-conducting transporter membrane subunit [Clostridia bacterium]